ncbi:MAG: cardiolipin synthase [Gammaproteobacteria bacterium]|nr:cardiolipin synthase [Gammaproteobacteria bacterium]NND38197.1 cardiolipin synthase [Pseudomonadales bacterium]MBT8150078.1 cardiolipin synthase [Gammaproteobacteria bacterium]NNL11295.1 cardiolipin synthase [Pseudomonadales bacterium]NNM12431.1 cardiolipin synthase [Pseudomonadales bacterium]
MESWLYTNLLIFIYAAPALWAVYHILMFKRDYQAALSWILACVFIPYLGPFLYFLFGINRVRTRARKLDRNLFIVPREKGVRKAHSVAPSGVGTDQSLIQVGHKVCGHILIRGNAAEALYNGEQAYPRMLDAIENAEHSILLSTYIFKDDATGMEFIDALQRAVGRGVDVKVLLDGIGEYYSFHKASAMLRKRGVNAAKFLPPRFIPPSFSINLRNHRKLLLVDESEAFAGGMNIGAYNLKNNKGMREVTDINFSFKGAIVDELIQLFYHDWNFTTGGKASPPRRSNVAAVGNELCRLIPDGPSEELDALALTIRGVISAAKNHIYIMTPYFLPNRELVSAMQSAALRGVAVNIVLPERSNIPVVHWANRNVLEELLSAGASVYYQPKPFCHSKLLCIDDSYTLVGSANLDPRSLRLNFELGIEIFSTALNQQLLGHFRDTIAVSEPLLLADLTGRGVYARLRDSVAALFTPYL